jgi:hypothetical protein
MVIIILIKKKNSPRNLQAQLKTAQTNTRPKFLIELANPTQEKIEFKKFPSLQKIKNTQTHNPTMGAKPTTDRHLTTRTTRTPAGNTGLAKVAEQCFV